MPYNSLTAVLLLNFAWPRSLILRLLWGPTLIILNLRVHLTLLFVVQSLKSCPTQPFATPWTAAHQTSLSFTISWTLLKLMPIESVMPSNRLILCRPLFLLPSILPSIRVFSNESALPVRWPKYWSFIISLSNEYSGLIFLEFTGFEYAIIYTIDLQKTNPGPCLGMWTWGTESGHRHLGTGGKRVDKYSHWSLKWGPWALVKYGSENILDFGHLDQLLLLWEGLDDWQKFPPL